MKLLRNKVAAALLAAVVLGAVVLAVGGAYVKQQMGAITVTAQFDSAAGLYEGNVVAVLGMPVGEVKKIRNRNGYVEVEFTVDKGVNIPADVQAATISNSILTDRQIELTPPYRWSDAAEQRHDRFEPHPHTGGVRAGARCSRQARGFAAR